MSLITTLKRLLSKYQRTNYTNEEFLCDDCRAVNWSSLPTLAADGLLGTGGLDQRTVSATTDELRNSSCKICAILSNIKDPFNKETRCVLTALPLSRYYKYNGDRSAWDSVSRCAALCIVRHMWGEPWALERCYEACSLVTVTTIDQLRARTIAPNSVDYSKFMDLLETCEKEHKVSCAIEPRPNVLGLEVIDIRTQKVVKAPDRCKYLALSYVWGKKSGSSVAHNIRNPPPVIRDAISVTKYMGYRYLWVDRYVSHSGLIYKRVHGLRGCLVYLKIQREAPYDQPNGPDICQRLLHNYCGC